MPIQGGITTPEIKYNLDMNQYTPSEDSQLKQEAENPHSLTYEKLTAVCELRIPKGQFVTIC